MCKHFPIIQSYTQDNQNNVPPSQIKQCSYLDKRPKFSIQRDAVNFYKQDLKNAIARFYSFTVIYTE